MDDRIEVSLAQLQALERGDPWLSAGLLKDGDPIYLAKWETEWDQPRLFHIQSIADVELFGINADNYGDFVFDRSAWEAEYGFSVDDLDKIDPANVYAGSRGAGWPGGGDLAPVSTGRRRRR